MNAHGHKLNKQKRRSKHDNEGRDFQCNFCEKTYLSYPAMYTHMRTKHSIGPDGRAITLNSTRGRGRPKKNSGKCTKISPDSDAYFSTFEKRGGPTDPIKHLRDMIEELVCCKGDWAVPEQYPLFTAVKKYSFESTPKEEKKSPVQNEPSKPYEADAEYNALSEEQKYMIS